LLGTVTYTTAYFADGFLPSVLFFCREEINIIKENQINYEIRDRELRVIDENGQQLGIMTLDKALALSESKNLDLVKISSASVPPVCKIMDYGKFRFEKAKKEKEARKNQKVAEIKEVWLSMTIEENDLNVKAKQARKFLDCNNKVKVSIKMKGRQQAHPEMGVAVMNKFFEILKDVSVMERAPLKEGKNILMILAPIKK
jgi:translation initiation factor IF-3